MHRKSFYSTMDIEDYLAQKRNLEKRKDDLESKEKLKEKAEKGKKELFKEKGLVPKEHKHEPKRVHSTPPDYSAGYHDPMRKMIVWNMLLLLLIVVMGVVLFFVITGNEPTTIVVEEDNEINDTIDSQINVNQTGEIDNQTQNETPEDPEKYEGPDMNFFAKDPEFGEFDSSGKLSNGEFVVVYTPFYNDIELHMTSEEATRTICFVDKEVSADTNFDGREDASSVLRAFVWKLTKFDQEIASDALPSGLGDDWDGQGKVTANYEVACYYCEDNFCNKWDEHGETIKTARIVVSINPPLSGGEGNNSNSS